MPEISEEDSFLFRKTIENMPDPQDKDKAEKKIIAKDSESGVKTATVYLSDPYFYDIGVNTVLAYRRSGVSHKRFIALKSGHIAWKSRLDLHGLNSEVAKETLIAFVLQECAQDHACFLLIHGKGGYKGQPPILKNLVNHWLSQMPQVLAFASAVAKDGGTGALYVLLQRQRI